MRKSLIVYLREREYAALQQVERSDEGALAQKKKKKHSRILRRSLSCALKNSKKTLETGETRWGLQTARAGKITSFRGAGHTGLGSRPHTRNLLKRKAKKNCTDRGLAKRHLLHAIQKKPKKKWTTSLGKKKLSITLKGNSA